MNAQIETIIDELGKRISAKSGLGGTMKFDFGEDGSVFIDGASEPNSVTSGEGKKADCTITLSLDTFQKLVTRTLDPTMAFMQGKLKVAGDMGLAMKLAPLLGRG